MPILATIIMQLVTILVGIFGRFFVLEKAFKLASFTVVVALVTALVSALRSCVDGVCGAAISGIGSIHPQISVGLAVVFNSTTYAAASCYISVWTLCQLYVMKKKAINLFSAS